MIKLVGNEIYVGGSFQGITDVLAPGVAHWTGSQWEPLGTGTAGGVASILIEGSDVYVGGSFSSAGEVDTWGIAKWDGSSWSAVGQIDPGPYLNLQIAAISRYQGQLCIAGWRQIDHTGGTKPIFATWDGISWTYHVPNNYYGSLFSMRVDGTNVYLGGYLSTPFTPFPYVEDALFRWDGSNLTTLGSGLQGTVYDLSVVNGNLYAAGSIYSSGATTIRDFGVWDGSNWFEVGGGIGVSANAFVSSLAYANGVLYVAGDYDKVGAINSKDLAWWDGSQWHPYTGAPIGMSAFGNSLIEVAADVDNVFVSGDFNRVDGVMAYGLGRWDGVNWHSIANTPQYGTNDEVLTLAPDGTGGLYAGGVFVYAGDTQTGCVAHFDGDGWQPLGTGLSGAFLSVYALANDGSQLFAGGRFTVAGGVSVQNLARWNGSMWSDVGGGVTSGSFPLVSSLTVNGTNLYVGGIFTQAGPVPVSNIARWNGTNWDALGGGTNGQVSATIFWNGLLYVGGNFTTAGSASASRVASWDGATWTQVGAGFNQGVNGFAVFDDELYAGGNFSNSGGQPMVGIAKWNGSAWEAVGGGLSSGANDIEATANGVFVCGPFTSAGGNPAARIAKWTGTEWLPLDDGFGGIGVSAPLVKALAAVDQTIFVGGKLVRADDRAVSYIARWNDATSTAADPIPVARTALGSCVPNPFNPSTRITYTVGDAGRVTLEVYDVTGRYICTLVDRTHAASTEVFEATWDGRDASGNAVASGVYFCRMLAASVTDTRKMVLLK